MATTCFHTFIPLKKLYPSHARHLNYNFQTFDTFCFIFDMMFVGIYVYNVYFGKKRYFIP